MMQTKPYPGVGQMRTEISKVYPGYRWPARVKDMKDNQVKAIWHRMVRDGQLKF